MSDQTTRYSERVEGDEGNYNWPVRFDVTEGHVGITQYGDKGEIERVLLSPAQWKALGVFMRAIAEEGAQG